MKLETQVSTQLQQCESSLKHHKNIIKAKNSSAIPFTDNKKTKKKTFVMNQFVKGDFVLNNKCKLFQRVISPDEKKLRI